MPNAGHAHRNGGPPAAEAVSVAEADPIEDALAFVEQSRFDEAVAIARAVLDGGAAPGAEAPGRPILRDAYAEAILGLQEMRVARYSSGLRMLIPLVDVLEASDKPGLAARVLSYISFALGALGDPERGLVWAGRSVALCERFPQEGAAVSAWANLGALRIMLEDFDGAFAAMGKAREIAMERGNRRAACTIILNMANVYQSKAEREDPRPSLEEIMAWGYAVIDLSQVGLRLAEELSDRFNALFARSNLAYGCALVGDLDGAQAWLDSYAADPSLDGERLGESYLCQGLVFARRGRAADAEAWFRKTLDLAIAESIDRLVLASLSELSKLAEAALDYPSALHWERRRSATQKKHFDARLRSVADAFELVAEAERARREAKSHRERAEALAEANRALESSRAELRVKAERDALTATLNRCGFEAGAEEAWNRASRACVAMIDLDYFKRVNDRFGHAVGDEVLRAVGSLLIAHCRDADVLGRLGGEEFALVLPDSTVQGAVAACERIRAAVEGYGWDAVAPGLRLTTSLGLARKEEGLGLKGALARADSALYRAKAGGRNRVVMDGA